jgi:hypothetical protein
MTKKEKVAILDLLENVGYELINLDGTVDLGEEAFKQMKVLKEAWKLDN